MLVKSIQTIGLDGWKVSVSDTQIRINNPKQDAMKDWLANAETMMFSWSLKTLKIRTGENNVSVQKVVFIRLIEENGLTLLSYDKEYFITQNSMESDGRILIPIALKH